jgi:hypothetical protein
LGICRGWSVAVDGRPWNGWTHDGDSVVVDVGLLVELLLCIRRSETGSRQVEDVEAAWTAHTKFGVFPVRTVCLVLEMPSVLGRGKRAEALT